MRQDDEAPSPAAKRARLSPIALRRAARSLPNISTLVLSTVPRLTIDFEILLSLASRIMFAGD